MLEIARTVAEPFGSVFHGREIQRARITGSFRVVLLFLLLVLWIGAADTTAGAPTDSTQILGVPAQDENRPKRRGRLALLPIVFSSPNTGFAFGVLPQYFFRTTAHARPSNFRLDAYYTQEKQYHIQLSTQVWMKEDAYRLTGKMSFKKWPTSFYGVGPRASKQDKEPYEEHVAGLSIDLQRRVHPGIFLGGGYGLKANRIRDTKAGGLLEGGTIAGSEGGTTSSVWTSVTWDTRDQVYYPSMGRLYQVAVGVATPMIGSDFRFAELTVDLRQYFSLLASHVLAVQTYGRFLMGDSPPFRSMGSVGDVLRGYSSARYVDRCTVALQAEYRVVPAWWRIGFVGFAGLGQVADRPARLSLKNLKYVIGAGLRFQLYRREKINVRWDYGQGRDAAGDYMDIAEAF